MTLHRDLNGFASEPIALADDPACASASLPCGDSLLPAVVAVDEDDDDDMEELPVEELPPALEPVDDFEEDDFDDEFDDDFEEELEDDELDETVTEADLRRNNDADGDDAEFDDE